MSDPIDRLAELRETGEVPTLPAAVVRRRGDRIRRRRQAAIAVGSALAVVLIVTPIALLTAGGAPGRVDPAPAPTAPTPSPVTLTDANLMTPEDTEFDAVATWRVGQTYGGDGPVVVNPCQQQTYDGLGAGAVFQRDWGLEAHGLHQAVAEFPSAAEAEAAYDRLDGWQRACMPRQTEGYEVTASTDVAIPVDGAAQVVEARFRLLAVEEGGEASAEQRMMTGLAVVGDRLTVLTHTLPGGPGSRQWNIPPVERMLPAAAARLVAAEPPTADQTTTDPSSSDTTTPAGVDLLGEEHLVGAGGLPAVPDRQPWQQVPSQAVPTLTCQGAWLSSLGPTDTVTRELRIPEQGAGYDLGKANVAVLAFADRDAADAAYGTVSAWLEQCPASQQDAEPRIDTPAAPADVSGTDRAHQVRIDYLAPEVCPDGCDAAWFEHGTVAQVDDRLVLVTYAELAGPCPPGNPNVSTCDAVEEQQSWLDRVAAAVEAAVGAATHDAG